MDYKKRIIDLIKTIDDKETLSRIYAIITTWVLKNSKK